MSRRLLRRRGSIPGPPESPLQPIQELSSEPEFSTPIEYAPSSLNQIENGIDIGQLLSTPFSPISIPPSRSLPPSPPFVSPYIEDKISYSPIVLSPNTSKSLNLSFDSDPVNWMKKSCSNQDVSAITYLDYQEFEKLDLFNIRFLSSDGKSFQDEVQCISRQELLEWLSSDINVLPPTNIMSIYTPPKDTSPSSLETGFTAKPTKRYVVRLPPSNFYVTFGSVHRLLSLPDRHWFALPLFGGQRKRVGNIFGYYGSSMNHGQVPGEIIYKLYTLDDLQQTITVDETIDDYPIPIDLVKSDLSLPFIPTDEYISYLYGTDNSTFLFLQLMFKELFSTYISNTRFTSPYSLINTLSYETSVSIDLVNQIFLKNPLVHINTQNTKGYTALMVLLLNKFSNIPDAFFPLLFSFLLSKNPDVDITNDDDNSTSVMYAFAHQKIYDSSLLLQILNLSKKFDTKNKDGWDASMFAFNNEIIYQYPSQLILSILNKVTNINRQERKFGWSLLMIIFKNSSPHLSNKSIIDKIFSLNPDFNIQNKRGKTAFMYAALNHNKNIHYSVFNRILSLIPDVNISSIINETVLSIALSSPYASNNFILTLINKNEESIFINNSLKLSSSIILDDDDQPPYNPEQVDEYSPLMFALENPKIHPSVILKILSLNPDIDHTNKFNETALMLAINNRSKHITSDVLLSILNLNPNINKQDSNGHTAISLALSNFSGQMTESFILHLLDLSPNVNLNATDEEISPLMISLFNQSTAITPKIVLKILSLNPYINHVSKSGYTFLTVCIETLTRADPSTFISLELLDYLLTLPIDYSINKHILLSVLNNSLQNLSNFPTYLFQYKPVLDKIIYNLQQ